MSTKISTARPFLKDSVSEADSNGNGVLASQEVKSSGFFKSHIKVLNQALSVAANSAGGQSVDNVKRKLDAICDEFERRDTDNNGRLSAAEIAEAGSVTTRAQLRQLNKFVTTVTINTGGFWPELG
jgi:hypothetical protein